MHKNNNTYFRENNVDSARQHRKATSQWTDFKGPVRTGRWSLPERIFLVKQNKWDNESVHLKQGRGGGITKVTADPPHRNCAKLLASVKAAAE